MKTIKLFATLRDIAGVRELHVPFQAGQSVRDLVKDVQEACPALGEAMLDENGELSGLVHIMVQGRNVQWLQGMDTLIHESDSLVFIPPAAGG
jgi:molybdopterin synthase sulfur carrier subunit